MCMQIFNMCTKNLNGEPMKEAILRTHHNFLVVFIRVKFFLRGRSIQQGKKHPLVTLSGTSAERNDPKAVVPDYMHQPHLFLDYINPGHCQTSLSFCIFWESRISSNISGRKTNTWPLKINGWLRWTFLWKGTLFWAPFVHFRGEGLIWFIKIWIEKANRFFQDP